MDVSNINLTEGEYALDYFFYFAERDFEEIKREDMPTVIWNRNTGEFFLVTFDRVMFRVRLVSIGKGSRESIYRSVYDVLKILKEEQRNSELT